MIFLVQFGINKHLRARAILIVFEKFTRAYLFQNSTRNHVITYTNHIDWFIIKSHRSKILNKTRLLLKDKMIENNAKGHNTVWQIVPVHKISCLLHDKQKLL